MLNLPAVSAALLVWGLVGCTANGTGGAGPVAASSPAGRLTHPSSPAPSLTSPVANPHGLSDAQMVGQLFTTYVYGTGATTATTAQRAANIALYGVPTPADVLRRWHLGGVILIDHNNLDPSRPALSTGNLTNARQLSGLDAGLDQVAKADSGLPLLIGTDQEGGVVQRIPFLPNRPSELALSKLPTSRLECSYYQLGRQLAALGVNQDYAPDADVVRTLGGVIGSRSFGPDPLRDATDVVAAVRGLQAGGVLATLKHWPGHGSTSTDSHAALAVVPESAAAWEAVDRLPFAAAVDSAAAIMVGHLALPAIDPTRRPATLSPALNKDLLRRQLGFKGLVITDSMWMEPARAAGTPGRVAVLALEAGNDMILMPPDISGATAALLAKIHSDAGFRALVQQALVHIIAAKHQTSHLLTGCPAA